VERQVDYAAQTGCICRGRAINAVMAGLVEILEVERVIPHLFDGRTVERFLSDLKLEREGHRPNYEDDIDPPAHPRNIELEEDRSGEPGDLSAEQFYLSEPRVTLRRKESERAILR
jgi:hypothetical protein